MKIRAGGPCSCVSGRYVRFVIPRVPGLDGFISCRGVDAPKGDVCEHAIPYDAEIEVRIGVLE